MKKYLVAIVLGALAPFALLLHAQLPDSKNPEVDTAEVYRRGDYVEAVGQGPRSAIEEDYLAAVATPADDSHKWFITVITQPHCPPCEKLKSDLNTKPELQAFVNVTSPKQSWSHFNCYSSEDQTQSWRWKNIKITGYPTILVQPPLNKRYGDPATVVMQKTGYADAAKLAEQISGSIKTYVAKRKLAPASELVQRSKTETQGFQSGENQHQKYPRYSPTPTKGAFEQIRPWSRDVPAPFRPAPKTPVPAVTPAPLLPPDLEIPSVINPDAVPAPKEPTPAPPEPAKPDAVSESPVAMVIVDGNVAAEALSDPRFGRILGALKAKMANLTVKVADFATIKKDFPSLNKTDLPAILVTQDGTVREAMTSLLLPLLNDPQSQGMLLSLLTSFLTTGTIPWMALAAIGGIAAIRFIRARRQSQGLPPILGTAGQSLLDQILNSAAAKKIITDLIEKLKTPTK